MASIQDKEIRMIVDAARASADAVSAICDKEGVSEEYRDHQMRVQEARIAALHVQMLGELAVILRVGLNIPSV